MKLRLVLLALAGWLLLAPPQARAQMDSREGITLQNQILELRRDLQSMRDQMGRDQAGRGGGAAIAPVPRGGGNAGGGEMVAQLLDRVSRIEEQLRVLNGRQEELANRVQRLGEDLNKQVGDMNFRLQALESGGRPGGAPPATSPPPRNLGGGPADPPPPGQPPRAQRTPESMMQEGNAALARRDYAAAEAAARDVLAIRGTARAYDAQFLLAQALAGKRDHPQAALAFDDTYKRARTGRHAQDALLGLAGALAALNEKRPACDTLNTLRAEFPTPRPEVRDAAAALRQRAGCR